MKDVVVVLLDEKLYRNYITDQLSQDRKANEKPISLISE